MSREITIALAQTAPVLNDNEENLRRMAATIQRICSAAADRSDRLPGAGRFGRTSAG